MPVQAFVAKKPYEVSLSGNPMPYTINITPYGSAERAQDYRIVATVYVETAYGSNSFITARSQAFYPNENGQINFDVRRIINAYLEYYVPNPSLKRPIQAFNQRKRYRVDFLLMKANELIGDVQTGTILTAIKGGMSYDEWHPNKFFTGLVLDKKMPLQFDPLRKIAFDELRYFFWLYPYDDLKPQTVMIDINLDDDSTIYHNMPQTVSTGKWGVCCVPIGFNHIRLNQLVPPDRTAISFSVQVRTENTSIVAPFTFILEQRKYYNAYQLMYRNSIGGLETLYLRGQVDFEADYARQNVQYTPLPNYFSNKVLMGDANDLNVTETVKFKADTGFLNRPATDRLRDFFLSSHKYEIVPPVDEDDETRIYPATIATKNTKFFANRDNLISVVIEWSRAFSSEYYSPRMLRAKQACPAVEFFQVTQINKTLLQIMYSLEIPYDRIEVQVITSLGTQVFTYTGNTRTIRQAFENPVLGTSDTEHITVKARTICDEHSVPPDYGPFIEVELDIVGNTPPIANDDYFNIAYGFNTAVNLPGNLMANDYDPDGDAIECIADTGATADGGVYVVFADGTATYKPPSSVYVGQDSFDYTIEESTGTETDTATVYVNVGQVSGRIYVKMVQRNVETLYGPNSSITTGEVWLEFYTNPTVNQPVDITGMGLTINYNQHDFNQDYSGVVTNNDLPLSVIGTGTKMKVYEGTLENRYSDPAYSFEQIYQITFTATPGTGYIVI